MTERAVKLLNVSHPFVMRAIDESEIKCCSILLEQCSEAMNRLVEVARRRPVTVSFAERVRERGFELPPNGLAGLDDIVSWHS